MRVSHQLLEQLTVCHPNAPAPLEESAPLILLVTVEEGAAIREANGGWDNPGLQKLLPRLVTELGWKNIEHAARRTVVLSISAPGQEHAGWACYADTGTGFEAVEIVDGSTIEAGIEAGVETDMGANHADHP